MCIRDRYISYKLKKIDKSQYKLLNDTIRSLPLPKLKRLDSNEILTFIKRDKKYIKGKLNYITLKKIGEAEITTGIQDNLIVESLNKL